VPVARYEILVITGSREAAASVLPVRCAPAARSSSSVYQTLVTMEEATIRPIQRACYDFLG
jgi:hypothetical protein